MRITLPATASLLGAASLLAATLLLAGCGDRPAATSGNPDNGRVLTTLIDGLALRFIGVPDRRIAPTNAVLLDEAEGPDGIILQGHHNSGDGIIVRLRPSTGETTYISTPGGGGSWSIVPAAPGEAWLGSHLDAYLYHLEASSDTVTRYDLPRRADWIWSIDRASDGHLYLGTYPGGEVLRFEIETGIVTDLGPVIPDDGRERYVRSLNAEFPGKLYLGMGAEPELVEWDLETGRKKGLLPERFRDRSFVYNVDRVGDYLVASISPHVVILVIDPSSGKILHEIPAPNDASVWLGSQQSVTLHEGELFFGTRGDDALWAYDLANRTTRLVAAQLGGPFGKAHGRYLYTHNYFGTYFVYDLLEERIVVERKTRFEGAGMGIHTLAEGPAGSLVGGTYINQGFFRYFPESDSLYAPGPAVSFGGQIDQIVSHHGLMYLAHYTDARITVYDPARPWNPGYVDDANPRLVASAGEDQDRYPTGVSGSDGLLYFGTIPKYGKLGGALVVFDPTSESQTVYRNVVQDQSVYALVELDGVMYGSTAVVGGLGSKPTQASGKLFGWDMENREKISEHVPVEAAKELWGLVALPDDKLMGSADSLLYLYDPSSNATMTRRVVGPEIITRLVASRDGWVYGVTQERFFRASHDLETVETIDVHPGYWDSLAETTDGRLFVSREESLYEVLTSP